MAGRRAKDSTLRSCGDGAVRRRNGKLFRSLRPFIPLDRM